MPIVKYKRVHQLRTGPGLNYRPFNNGTTFNHFNTGLVINSDPHCTLNPRFTFFLCSPKSALHHLSSTIYLRPICEMSYIKSFLHWGLSVWDKSSWFTNVQFWSHDLNSGHLNIPIPDTKGSVYVIFVNFWSTFMGLNLDLCVSYSKASVLSWDFNYLNTVPDPK